MTEKVEIKRMPTQEELEEFLAGFHKNPKVYFNVITGTFEGKKVDDHNLGKPKTQQGEDWKSL